MEVGLLTRNSACADNLYDVKVQNSGILIRNAIKYNT